MPAIRVISLLQQETEHILAALKFFPFSGDCAIELHYVAWDSPVTFSPQLSLFPALSIDELCQRSFVPGDIIVFSSLAAHSTYCVLQKLSSHTLYVHTEIAILEADTMLMLPGLELCVLEGDAAQATIPKDATVHIYRDMIQFSKQKKADELLLTANHNLTLSLISIDKVNWEIFHPELNARNLALELWEEPFSHIQYTLGHAQNQLHDPSLLPSHSYDLAGIRLAHNADKHAYSFFAMHYDEYMQHVVYDQWVKRVVGWYKLYTGRALQRILELACGTANVSNRFVFQGLHVDACDLSAEMLHVADQKPMKPSLYPASLTDPIPGRDYDLILCMFDSVNYLVKSAHISQMLEQVHLALADGALFIFDISTLFNSEENFADICSLSHHKEGYLVHQAWYDPVKSRQNSSLTSFKQDFLGYSYQYELHKQRVYLCSELITLIHKSPLKLRAIHSTESKINFYPRHINGIDDKYSRLFFILQKEKI